MLVFVFISAKASFPKRSEERKSASTLAGTKRVPNSREKAKMDLNVFILGFIKQTKYREIPFLIPIEQG